MLIKNNTGSRQSKGFFEIKPGCWGLIPKKVAGSWIRDPKFETAEINKTPIYIFAGCPLGTTGGGQHPTQIARSLSRMGHPVIYVQNYAQPDPELYVIADDSLFSSDPVSSPQKIQKLELLFSACPPGIVLFTFPSYYCVSVAQYASDAGHLTAYWCLDDWTAINAAMGNRKYRSCYEEYMIEATDFHFATAESLARHVSNISKKETYVIPNGYSKRDFPLNYPVNKASIPIPNDLRRGSKTLVYWGELGGSWIDWELIERIAQKYPDYKINLIGDPDKCGKPVDEKNVYYLGEKPVGQLYRYGVNADVGLIPFMQDSVTEAVNPIKAYEYLACGLSVLGPINMSELEKFPATCRYTDHKNALSLLGENIFQMNSPMLDEQVGQFLNRSTWSHRADEFLKVLSCHLLSTMQL